MIRDNKSKNEDIPMSSRAPLQEGYVSFLYTYVCYTYIYKQRNVILINRSLCTQGVRELFGPNFWILKNL